MLYENIPLLILLFVMYMKYWITYFEHIRFLDFYNILLEKNDQFCSITYFVNSILNSNILESIIIKLVA